MPITKGMTNCINKPLMLTAWHKNYSWGTSGMVSGNVSGITSGMGCSTALSCKRRESERVLPVPSEMFESKMSTSKSPASNQVLRSRKSEVFWTPPICCPPPPKDEDRPPPLGFWTITTKTSRKHTKMIKAMKIEKLPIIFYCCCNFFIFWICPAKKTFFSGYFKLKIL